MCAGMLSYLFPVKWWMSYSITASPLPQIPEGFRIITGFPQLMTQCHRIISNFDGIVKLVGLIKYILIYI